MKRVWISVALATLVLVVYARVGGHAFVNLDDEAYIVDNPYVQPGLTAAGASWALTGFLEGNWHPLTWVSHMLDVTLFGMHAGPMHVESAVLHALSAVLLFLALHALTGELWPSAFAAALFAVHPLRVESVAWAAERKDVLSGVFFMLTLLAYARYVRRRGTAAYLLVVLAFVLGLMAKPMLVTVPFVLLLLDFWPLGRVAVLEKLPLFALSAASSVLTLAAQKGAGVVGPLAALPLATRLASAATGYVFYLRKAILPTGLAVFYPLRRSIDARTAPGLCALLLLAITVLALLAIRRVPYVTVGWLWYLGMLVPVIGLVQIGLQGAADRYAYLPLVGIQIALAWGARDLAARGATARAAVVGTAALVIVACAVLAFLQVSVWRDSRALFEHALRAVPTSYVAENGLAIERARAGDLSGAAAGFERAIALDPEYAFAHYNLGLVRLNQGSGADAEPCFREAIRLYPAYGDAHLGLGLVLERRGAVAEAAAEYEETLRIAPGLPDARAGLERTTGRRP